MFAFRHAQERWSASRFWSKIIKHAFLQTNRSSLQGAGGGAEGKLRLTCIQPCNLCGGGLQRKICCPQTNHFENTSGPCAHLCLLVFLRTESGGTARIARKASPPFGCRCPPGRLGRIWSGGAPCTVQMSAAQRWPSWKSHQKKPHLHLHHRIQLQ